MKRIFSVFLVVLIITFSISFNSKAEAASNYATRADAIVEIGKLLGLDGTQRKTQFKDVPKSHYASGYIQSAVDKGITSGYANGTFKPDEALTRGHFAVFISKAFGNKLPAGSGSFKDVTKKSSYYGAVRQLVAAGITSGYPDGTFKPNNKLTKVHLTTFINKTSKYLKNNSKTNNKGSNNTSSNNTSSNNTIVTPTVEYGTLKGNVTWQYNKYIGTKADVGAQVFLIPYDFDYKKYTKELESFVLGIQQEKANLFVAKVDGYGTYEIQDIPVGKYLAVISSKNTRRDILSDIPYYVKDPIENLIGTTAYEKFELFNLKIYKHTWSIVEIKKDKILNNSHDFGYTYY